MRRLAPPFGTRIDRTRPLRFSFDGRNLEGFAGDTIASALAANGQMLLSRSFKYHRPRGLHSLTGADANALVQVVAEPNVDAGLTPLSAGMKVTAQNVNGSLDRDRDAIIDRIGRFLPVGFYYCTFMGPTPGAWLKLWEPLLRKKAGLGKVDMKAVSTAGTSSYLHCDLLVVGGGAAGLAAAIEAAEAGADVVLCEAEPELGGSLTYRDAEAQLSAMRDRAKTLVNLRVMTGTGCNGWYEDNWLALIAGDRLYRTRARHIILATGTIEQPAVFQNNDLPGIMPGGTVLRLIRHYGVQPGSVAVVLAATPEGHDVARALRAAGVTIERWWSPGHFHALQQTTCAKPESLSSKATSKRHEARNAWPRSKSVDAGSIVIWLRSRQATCPPGNCLARPEQNSSATMRAECVSKDSPGTSRLLAPLPDMQRMTPWSPMGATRLAAHSAHWEFPPHCHLPCQTTMQRFLPTGTCLWPSIPAAAISSTLTRICR